MDQQLDMAHPPVSLMVPAPPRYERAHILVRILVLAILSFPGAAFGWIFWLLYLGLPTATAILLQQKDGTRFMAEDAPRLGRGLHWLVAFFAYLYLLTDRFPSSAPERTVGLVIVPEGRPSIGSALLRLVYSLPAALLLAVLGSLGGILWLVAAVWVLVSTRYPNLLREYFQWIVGLQAQLLAYHASLVERYPSLHPGARSEPTPTTGSTI